MTPIDVREIPALIERMASEMPALAVKLLEATRYSHEFWRLAEVQGLTGGASLAIECAERTIGYDRT